MSNTHIWNAKHYDQQAAFVSRFGQNVIELLQPKPKENILDIGCGTGDLMQDIARAGAYVSGIDSSSEMISRAKSKYPNQSFYIADAEDLSAFYSDHYDAVFSNAAFHWMKRPECVLASIYSVLKTGGRLTAEFGGKGNVAAIIRGISTVMAEHFQIDIHPRIPWYFPSIGEYTNLLEKQGFYVSYAHHFPRPTFLGKGDRGLNHWLDQFAKNFFPEFTEREGQQLYTAINHELASELKTSDGWYADYQRIRIVAHKIE
ncbi:class I SAM-dependent methyltransferase [Marinococcus sp. PL1-022]|uniref:class I SAM-dependent methyltransferase n=1 Tax=Marinococcus sp. PL1-022 TaxID=3095363 RepID=UPI0029C53FF2|nr:class I SAM-dependent methyltransferase [Marinococcus sp. PL1-022]MDX6152610.1 class I SAM-dependent methyltransferase [Marinococcus sp. PL1-022]